MTAENITVAPLKEQKEYVSVEIPQEDSFSMDINKDTLPQNITVSLNRNHNVINISDYSDNDEEAVPTKKSLTARENDMMKSKRS